MRKIIKVNVWTDVPKNFTGIVKHAAGTTTYLQDGHFHREDGPARMGYGFEPKFYLDGLPYPKQLFWQRLYRLGKISKERLFLELL